MFQAGAAASMAEVRKCSKYQDMSYSHLFIPVAVETICVWGPETTDFIEALGRRLFAATQDRRSAQGSFLGEQSSGVPLFGVRNISWKYRRRSVIWCVILYLFILIFPPPSAIFLH